MQSAQEAQHLSRQAKPRSAAEAVVMAHLSPGMRPSCVGKPAKREVLVVVSNLEELEDHWQVRLPVLKESIRQFIPVQGDLIPGAA